MKWRNPKKELPQDEQRIFVMIDPHKKRGPNLVDSAISIQIAAGWAYFDRPSVVRVENRDELGEGAIEWLLYCPEDLRDDIYGGNGGDAIAWIPVEEMDYPDWL